MCAMDGVNVRQHEKARVRVARGARPQSLHTTQRTRCECVTRNQEGASQHAAKVFFMLRRETVVFSVALGFLYTHKKAATSTLRSSFDLPQAPGPAAAPRAAARGRGGRPGVTALCGLRSAVGCKPREAVVQYGCVSNN